MYPLAFKVCKQYIKELDIDIENGRIVGYTCCTVCSMASPAPSSATLSGPLYLHRPPHRPCSGDLVTTTTTITITTAAAAAAVLLLVVVGVGVVLQWCADVPVVVCAAVCRRWSPAAAAARQRARGGAWCRVAQSGGGEHGSQAAHRAHCDGHPCPRAGAAGKPRSWLLSTE